MSTLNLSKHDLERIEELKQTFGFEVVNAGFSCNKVAPDKDVQLCYWRNKRGVRESAIFPNHEAAWRDALRTHEEAVDAVKANPGVHRVKAMPGKQAAELSRLKKLLLARGFSFSKEDMPDCDPLKFEQYSHFWKRGELKVGMFKSHADAIRDAIKIWARDDAEDFVNSMNVLGNGGEDTAISTLSSEELAKLQGMPGFFELPEKHQTLAIQSQQLMKHMAQRGITIDMSLIEPGTLVEAASVSYKSQGKSFEEVEEDQRNAAKTDPAETSARAAGWTNFEDSEDASLLVVAHDNRDVHFTGPEAWEQACQWEKDNELWNGVGQPPVGTTLWITPHNTFWGFPEVGTYLCEVLAYHSDYVWLQLLSDTGEVVLGKYVTTRTDKVDVKVWKGNKDA